MIVEENFKNIGSFIYKLLFGLNVPLTYDEIIDIVQYREKYVNEDSEFGLPLVKRDIDLYKNFKLFFDFEFKNKYKVWNMVNGNNFFQKYIEDNIIF